VVITMRREHSIRFLWTLGKLGNGLSRLILGVLSDADLAFLFFCLMSGRNMIIGVKLAHARLRTLPDSTSQIIVL